MFLYGVGLNVYIWDMMVLVLQCLFLVIDFVGYGDLLWCEDVDYVLCIFVEDVVYVFDVWMMQLQFVVGQLFGGFMGVVLVVICFDLVFEFVIVDIMLGVDVLVGLVVLCVFYVGLIDFVLCDEFVEKVMVFGFGGMCFEIECGVFLNMCVCVDGCVEWKYYFVYLVVQIFVVYDFGIFVMLFVLYEIGWDDLVFVMVVIMFVCVECGFVSESDVVEFQCCLFEVYVVVVDVMYNVQEMVLVVLVVFFVLIFVCGI